MDCVSAPAFVSVPRRPETGKMIVFTVAVVLCVVAIVGGLAVGHWGSVIILSPLLLAFAAARRAGRSSEVRCVEVSLTWQDPYLLVFLPGARLCDGEYVDQQYVCERSWIDCIELTSQDDFVLRAGRLDSVACCGAIELNRKVLGHIEVSFKIVGNCERVRDFLVAHAL